jgi:hypothetical protein
MWFNLNLVQTSFHYSYGSSDLSLSVLLIPINMLYWKISFTRGVSRLWAIIVESNLGMIDDFSSNRRRAGVERHDNIPNVPREVVSRQGNCSVERENTAVQLPLQLSRLHRYIRQSPGRMDSRSLPNPSEGRTRKQCCSRPSCWPSLASYRLSRQNLQPLPPSMEHTRDDT